MCYKDHMHLLWTIIEWAFAVVAMAAGLATILFLFGIVFGAAGIAVWQPLKGLARTLRRAV